MAAHVEVAAEKPPEQLRMQLQLPRRTGVKQADNANV